MARISNLYRGSIMLTFQQAAERWLKEMSHKRTIASDHRKLWHLCNVLKYGDLPLDQLSKQVINNWIQLKQQQKPELNI